MFDTPVTVCSCGGSPLGCQRSLSGGGKDSYTPHVMGFSWLPSVMSFSLWLVLLSLYPECGLFSFCWMGFSLVSFLVVIAWVRGRPTLVSPGN